VHNIGLQRTAPCGLAAEAASFGVLGGTMRRIAPLAISTVLLVGCGFVKSMVATQKQANLVADALEKQLGSRPFVAWNVQNDTLARVDVIFKGSDVGKMTVAELEPVVRNAVARGFTKQPQQLLISVQFNATAPAPPATSVKRTI
jgi:hypothetical protein